MHRIREVYHPDFVYVGAAINMDTESELPIRAEIRVKVKTGAEAAVVAVEVGNEILFNGPVFDYCKANEREFVEAALVFVKEGES